MSPKSSVPALSAAVEPPGCTLPCRMILSVSWQLVTVVPSSLVQVPTMPGPETRILLKPVGEPTTRCGVAASPMKPAGGAPAPVDPKVSQVRKGPRRPDTAAVKLAGIAPVSKRQPLAGWTRPVASAVQVYE